MVLVLFLSVARKIPGNYIERRQTDSLKILKFLPHTISFPFFPRYKPLHMKRLKTNLFTYRFIILLLINGIVQATSATWYGLDGLGFESRRKRDFSHPSRTAVGPTQLPIELVPGRFPRGKAAGERQWSSTPFYSRGSRKSSAIGLLPSGPSWPVLGWTSPYLYRLVPTTSEVRNKFNFLFHSVA
jgi:hypothetical protein